MAETDVKNRVELFRQEFVDEVRVVSLEQSAGHYTIIERTDGSQTYLCFGVLTQVRRLVLAPDDAARLSSELGASGGESLTESLGAFFSDGSFLSDLQDFLDAAAIPYTYINASGSQTAMRRGAGQPDPAANATA